MFIVDPSVDLEKQLESLLGDEKNPIANMANFSAFIYSTIPHLNWAGFYLIDKSKNNGELVLGPFQGGVACIRIAMGKGVCGSAASQEKTIVVDDVDKFPGHIACDSATRSELVIPILASGKLVGVFDLDSPQNSRFDSNTKDQIESLVNILVERTDWTQLS